MAFLEINNIKKSYYLGKEEFPVLKGITLDFELGEFVSILGESGGGKSTLMNIIGGLDREFQGEVKVNGEKLDHRNEKELDKYRRETVGYIYQSYNLISHLTVLDNVLISLDMTNLSKSERESRAKHLLEQVGLSAHIHKYPNQLSGGQKQRVAIARALANDPKIIIADEPTGALDSQNTEEVLKILNGIANEGRLVITVTHSQEVASTGTRIVHLIDGKIGDEQRIRPASSQSMTADQMQSRKLPLAVSFKMALKHLKFNFWRNSLIAFGTAIGLFAVILFSGLGNGISGYISKQVTAMANPQVVSVSRYSKTTSQGPENGAQNSRPGGTSTTNETKTITESQLEEIKQLKNVTSVERSYTASSVTIKANNQKEISALTFTNWTKAITKESLVAGHAPKKGEIVINKTEVAKRISKKNWKDVIGKKIRFSYVTTNKAKQPVTVAADVVISGIVESSNSNMASNYINTATLTHALKQANVATDKTSSVAVKINDLDQVNQVTKQINRIRNQSDKRVFKATSVSSLINTIKTYINLASTVLAAIAGISLIVSALMIIVTMYMSVSARTKEIGILRALGESKRDIRRLFISESLIIGLASAVIGTLVAYGSGAVLNIALSSLAAFSFVQISWINVITVFAIALIISLIAAVLPARHAASVNPIDALSAE
ncbi:ATP-binding cassette domain-containing protein [Pediococcus siamensis]|uniref:ABC transporter ATP-binding protein/permease n=1 Tax=Pediococcus siamensis TaxID=381829 RepID=UPI0039A2AF54